MNMHTNRPSEKKSPTITDVYLRCLVGPGLAPNDPAPVHPPARPIEIDYPHISTQPQYAAEVEKCRRFAAEREAAEVRLADLCKRSCVKVTHVEQTEEQMISNAESLLAGQHSESLQSEIDQTVKLIEALTRAIEAQHRVLLRVTRELSQAAGRRYAKEHKQRVKRLISAVLELQAANQAEIDLHHDLNRLGYIEGALPAMFLNRVEDPNDTNGNVTHYWYREAASYVKTDAEIAAGVRKARLAAAVVDNGSKENPSE